MFEKEAEEYANKNVPIYDFGHRSLDDVHYDVKQAYLAGLKAGKDMAEADLATVAYMHGAERYKTKWHKVTEGDYPPCKKGNYYSVNVLTDRGDIAYYNYTLECWVAEPVSAEIDPPIAWCKIPTFKE